MTQPEYTEEQKAEAVRLQMAYRGAVKAAHAKLEQAKWQMTHEVDAAQEARDMALRAVGIDPNHLRDHVLGGKA